ncbi:MAG: imidazolonepropionase [Fimbriimonadia bacterium]
MNDGNLLLTEIGELWTCAGPRPLRGAALSGLTESDADAIAIARGKVVAVGRTEEMRNRFDFPEFSVGKRLVTPGLIDPHTHTVFAGHRGDEFAMRCAGASYAQIAAAGGGIRRTVEQTRRAPFEELLETARDRLEVMVMTGTTTVEVKTGYGLNRDAEMKMLDVIYSLSNESPVEVIPTFMGAHMPDPDRDADSYVKDLAENLIPLAAQHPAAPRFNDVFCDEGAFDLAQTRAILEAGQQYFLQPKVHAEEFAHTGAARLAVDMGAASAEHLLQATDDDIEALAASNTAAVLLPGTCFYLNLPHSAPARKMIEAGCIVALGSDFNPGSCNISSMHFIMGLACLRMSLTPAEALGAATVNAAAAIGLEATHGQLAPGYWGDAVVWECNSLNDLMARFARPIPAMVIKRGNFVFPDPQSVQAFTGSRQSR